MGCPLTRQWIFVLVTYIHLHTIVSLDDTMKQCLPLIQGSHFLETDSVYMIAHCKIPIPSNDAIMCHQDVEEPILLPVIDNNNTVYKSYFCARCNDVYEYQNLPLQIICNSTKSNGNMDLSDCVCRLRQNFTTCGINLATSPESYFVYSFIINFGGIAGCSKGNVWDNSINKCSRFDCQKGYVKRENRCIKAAGWKRVGQNYSDCMVKKYSVIFLANKNKSTTNEIQSFDIIPPCSRIFL